MAVYQKILACLDGSKESLSALENALRLAKGLGVEEIMAITVVPIGAQLSSALSLFLGMKDFFRKNGEKILKEAEDIASEMGMKVKTILEEGEPYQKIVDMAYAEGADLLVMGKTGKGGLARGILGSTALRTIGSSPADVLIIPKDTTIKFNKILVPVDGSLYSERAALRALELAKHFKSIVMLLSVVELFVSDLYEVPGELIKLMESFKISAEEFVRKLKVKFREEGVSCESLVTEGMAPEKIIEFADKEKFDLIVMGSHGKTGLKRLLLGSVTERVINFGNKPVLVVKA